MWREKGRRNLAFLAVLLACIYMCCTFPFLGICAWGCKYAPDSCHRDASRIYAAHTHPPRALAFSVHIRSASPFLSEERALPPTPPRARRRRNASRSLWGLVWGDWEKREGGTRGSSPTPFPD